MCWNQWVSINTFLFGVFVLCLIAMNNRYSNYKIDEFKNPYMYFFFMSFISMQFFEFLLWRNLKNRDWNYWISMAGSFLLLIQPIASLMLLKDVNLRKTMLLCYSIPAGLAFFYNVVGNDFSTTVSKCGHLKWNWLAKKSNLSYLRYAFYLFFMLYSFYVNKQFVSILFALLLFAISYYSYYKHGSAGSLWCWIVNIVMIYYLCKICLVLPYQE